MAMCHFTVKNLRANFGSKNCNLTEAPLESITNSSNQNSKESHRKSLNSVSLVYLKHCLVTVFSFTLLSVSLYQKKNNNRKRKAKIFLKRFYLTLE